MLKNILTAWLQPKAVAITVITIIVVVFSCIGLKYVNGLVVEKNRLYTQLIGQQQAYKQLSDHAAQLEIDYKKESDLRTAAEAEFANEKGALLSQIKILSDATFLVRQKADQEKNSEVVFAGKAGDGFVLNEIKYDNGPAIGYVLIQNDGRVTSKMYDHIIDVHTVVSKDESTGKYSVVSKADYILKQYAVNTTGTDWTNKPFALNITGGTAQIDPTEPSIIKKHWMLWDPKFNINLDVDGDGFLPGAGVSLMGYGGDPNDLDFKFVQIGGHFVSKEILEPTITPVLWRPFHGLIDNTYVGPGVSYGDGHVKYFLGVQVGL